MSRPTLWLKNDSGEIWNLRPRPGDSRLTNSYFKELSGTGFEQKLTFTTVDNDFILTDEEATQQDITGTMYFTAAQTQQNFGDFLGGFTNSVKLYYDPTGSIQPENESGDGWYKEVRLAKMTGQEQDLNTAVWQCKCTFTPMSSMWRKAESYTTSTEAADNDAHFYEQLEAGNGYVYEFVYGSNDRLVCYVNNDGTPIGVRIEVINTSADEVVNQIIWTCINNGVYQYAEFNNLGLSQYQGLVVDSNPLDQECTIETYTKSGDAYLVQTTQDGQDKQEINPHYINFIKLGHGENRIVFGGDIKGDSESGANVYIRISFTYMTKAL